MRLLLSTALLWVGIVTASCNVPAYSRKSSVHFVMTLQVTEFYGKECEMFVPSIQRCLVRVECGLDWRLKQQTTSDEMRRR